MSKFQSPRSFGDAAASLCECFGIIPSNSHTHSLKDFLYGGGMAISKDLDQLGNYAFFCKVCVHIRASYQGPSSNDSYQRLITLEAGSVTAVCLIGPGRCP
jgi:hypothetical protein